MLKIKATATGDARKRLERLLAGLGAKRGAMMGKIAKRLEVDLREKFLSNGGRTFWQDASNSIYKAHTEDSASVVVKKVGVALQYFGGTVRPKNGRNLAIPLRPEFYGRNPREMTAKKLFVFGQRKAAGSGRLRLHGFGREARKSVCHVRQQGIAHRRGVVQDVRRRAGREQAFHRNDSLRIRVRRGRGRVGLKRSRMVGSCN